MELLPPVRQTLWGKLAVANFFLGGAGAGAYAVAACLSGLERGPLLGAASVLGPALVVTGFLSVAMEAGRPFRGPLVLRKVRGSWMSRELWAGGVFCLLALVDLLRPVLWLRAGAVAAALLLALAQGAILSRAKGVSAWSVPLMPLLFLVSALVSGAGVLSLASPLVGASRGLEAWMAALIILNALVWGAYLTWPGDSAFRWATALFRADSGIAGVFVLGHLLPLFLLLLGVRIPSAAWPVLAGAAVLQGQLLTKAWLILRAGEVRPITLPRLGLTRFPFCS